MLKLLKILFFCALVGGIIGWIATTPKGIDAKRYTGLIGDAGRGALVYAAGGCSSCHAAPKAKGDNKNILMGAYISPPILAHSLPPTFPHPMRALAVGR